jgi:hypothetical protein
VRTTAPTAIRVVDNLNLLIRASCDATRGNWSRASRWGAGVEQLEEFDEFAATMAILDQRMDLAGDEVDAGQ